MAFSSVAGRINVYSSSFKCQSWKVIVTNEKDQDRLPCYIISCLVK